MKLTTIFLGALVLYASMLSPSSAVSLQCDTDATKVTSAGTGSQGRHPVTASLNPVDVSGAAITFTVSSQSCAIVVFSAEGKVEREFTSLRVRAIVDGIDVCEPGSMTLIAPQGGKPSSFESRTVNFYCFGLSPGRHTVKIQFWAPVGGKVELLNRTTIVHYKT